MQRCFTPSDPRPHPTSLSSGRYAEMLCLECGNVFYWGWDDLACPRPFIRPCPGCELVTALPVWGRLYH